SSPSRPCSGTSGGSGSCMRSEGPPGRAGAGEATVAGGLPAGNTHWRARRRASIVAHVLLGIGAVLMLVPLIWTLSTSLKLPGSEFNIPVRWIPETWHFENYLEVARRVPLPRWFFNSLVVALAATVGQMLTGSMAGYAFARLRFRGRDSTFLMFLATM